MKLFHKKSGKMYIVANIIKVPECSDIYKLQDNKNNMILVNKADINKFYIVAKDIDTNSSKPIDYFNELDNIKEKVLERISKINEVIRWIDAKKTTLNNSSPEYLKLEQDEEKYKQDLKYYQKVLENVKDKIVDFASLQSRVNLERQIDLQELYNSIGLSPEKLNNEDVELFNKNQPKEIEVEKEIKIK